MRRIILIARREVVAYASVPSFWIALLMGPLLIVLMGLAAGSVGRPQAAPPAHTIALETGEGALRTAAQTALKDSARIEGRRIELLSPGASGGAQTTLTLVRANGGDVDLAVRGERLSEVALALLQRDLADAGRDGAMGVHISQPAPPPPAPALDPGRFARFSMTALLWLVLVGSLGMLLQAVVRERSNRALESLLAAARPSELLFGKLAGVGALSVLVVATWMLGGAAVAASPIGRATGGASLFHGLGDVQTLARAGVLFVLTFAMYGSALIGLGALARDVPAAQNLSRPVFGLLLLIFFIALAQIAGMGDASLPVLALAPPFTPFVLLLAKPGSIDAVHAGVGVAGMLLTTAGCAWLGAKSLRGELRLRWPVFRPHTAVAA